MDGHAQHSSDAVRYEEQSSMEPIEVEQLRRLVRLLDRSDVSEIEVKRADQDMHLVLRKAKVIDSAEVFVETASEEPPVVGHDHTQTVVAPLVGIFRSWIKPKGKPAVAVGDRIKVGQLIGTIMSLNVANEVESTTAGRVTEIFVQDGRAVEYGQPLIMVEGTEEG